MQEMGMYIIELDVSDYFGTETETANSHLADCAVVDAGECSEGRFPMGEATYFRRQGSISCEQDLNLGRKLLRLVTQKLIG